MLNPRRDVRLTVAIIAGAVMAGAGAAPRFSRDRLPDRIADTTFWRMVTTFSEPGGQFASENFVSNETEWQRVIPRALTRVNAASAYVGVGPEQNFTYIASFQPRIAFICDIRRQNLIQHLMYKALIEMSRDRASFLSMLWSRPRPAGLDASSEPAALVAAYREAKPDSLLYAFNLDAIFTNLVGRHRFALDSEDSATMRGVYSVFFSAGPDISYGSTSGRNGAIVPRLSGGSLTLPGGGGFVTFNTSGSVYSYTIGADSLGRRVMWRDSAGVQVRDTTLRFQPGLAGLVSFGAGGGDFATFADMMIIDDGAGVNRGWLGSERAFQWLKDFETRNLIIPVVGNFGGSSALRSIGKYLKDKDAKVSVFYTSNVEQYLFQNRMDVAFYGNVSSLPTDSNSIFIRSFPPSVRNGVVAYKPNALLAQTTSSIDAIVRAFRMGALRTYGELAALQDR